MSLLPSDSSRRHRPLRSGAKPRRSASSVVQRLSIGKPSSAAGNALGAQGSRIELDLEEPAQLLQLGPRLGHEVFVTNQQVAASEVGSPAACRWAATAAFQREET